jgi:hypothetical protein
VLSCLKICYVDSTETKLEIYIPRRVPLCAVTLYSQPPPHVNPLVDILTLTFQRIRLSLYDTTCFDPTGYRQVYKM